MIQVFRRLEVLDRECSFIKIEQGYILPHKESDDRTYGLGGVLRQDGSFVEESAFMLPMSKGDIIDWGGQYAFKQSDCEICNKDVIFAGFINNNEWGHFIVDWSVRLWYALCYDDQSDIVFCSRTDFELHRNIKRVLELAGIRLDRIRIIRKSDPVEQFHSISIPEPSLTKEGYHEEYKLLFKKVSDRFIEMNSQKVKFSGRIYLSRTAMRPRKEYGEKRLEQSFQSKGYMVIHPEQLTVDEQLDYYCGCEAMASIEGSVAHNIVFCGQGTEQIILEKQHIQNIRQMILNRIFENKVHYIKCYPRICFKEISTEGPFLVGRTKKFLIFSKEKGNVADILMWIVTYMRYITIYCAKWLRMKL